MVKRIDRLTDEQKAAIPAHVAKWIAIGQQCGEADWETWERGAKACYGFADIPFPKTVVRVPNPLVGALAAPIAAHIIAALTGDTGDKKKSPATELSEIIRDAATKPITEGSHAETSVATGVTDHIADKLYAPVGGSVANLTGDTYQEIHRTINGAIKDSTDEIARAVAASLESAVDVGLRTKRHAAPDVNADLRRKVINPLPPAVIEQASEAQRDDLADSMHAPVHGGVRTISEAVSTAVAETVLGSVGNLITKRAAKAVGEAVQTTLKTAVYDAVVTGVQNETLTKVSNEVKSTLVNQSTPLANLDEAVGNAIDSVIYKAHTQKALDGITNAAASDGVKGAIVGKVQIDPRDAGIRSTVGTSAQAEALMNVSTPVEGAVPQRGTTPEAIEAVINQVRQTILKEMTEKLNSAVTQKSSPEPQTRGSRVASSVGGAVPLRNEIHVAVHEIVKAALKSGMWYRYLGGQWWVNWQAWFSFFRDICDLELPGDLWDRDKAYAEAQSSAGWWWPHREFVMVTDRPRSLHLEQIAPPGWGSHRLHCATEAAITWEGWELYFWHGLRVPAWVINDPSPKNIFAERNAEIRRCGIESLGWDKFVDRAGLKIVGEQVGDPGNPGQKLALYELPSELSNMYREPARVLVCSNASQDRDGTRRKFGLPVPKRFNTPIAAAAATFDLSPADYAGLQRAT